MIKIKKENLIGLKFNMLTVIADAEDKVFKSGKREPAVLCRCDCGAETVVVKSSLKNGTTKSCGCLNKKYEDLTGKTFGNWTFLYRTKPGYWMCRCSCGTEKEVVSGNIKSGKSTSCGCIKSKVTSDRFSKDLTGEGFGFLTAIKKAEKKSNHKETYWLCKCDCGNDAVVRTCCLISGATKSCGCFKRINTSNLLSLDLSGKKFGKLEVIERSGTRIGKNGAKYSEWLCKCECGTYKNIVGHSLVSGGVISCGCISSKGEYEIRKILNSINVCYKTQYAFKDLKSEKGGILKFDFAIFDDNKNLISLIEYQGIQHFKEMPNEFGKQQREVTDKQKKEYCKNKNIPLFEIAYFENTEDKLLEILRDIGIIH